MAATNDPVSALRAAAPPNVGEGMSCSQSRFKAGNTAFHYAGPGVKSVGRKAAFRQGVSLYSAAETRKRNSAGFDVGKDQRVAAMSSSQQPLPLKSAWLTRSYAAAAG